MKKRILDSPKKKEGRGGILDDYIEKREYQRTT